MTLKQIECPACGGMVTIDDSQDTCFCSYCGRQISVGERKTVVIRDEARLRELELHEAQRLRNEQLAEAQKQQQEEKAHALKIARIRWVLAIIVSTVLLFVFIIFFSRYTLLPLVLFAFIPFIFPFLYPMSDTQKERPHKTRCEIGLILAVVFYVLPSVITGLSR